MLDDREQRVLDATEALLDREEPDLAAHLRHHSLAPGRGRDREGRHRRQLLGVPVAVWPPAVMIAFCLLLVIVPALLL